MKNDNPFIPEKIEAQIRKKWEQNPNPINFNDKKPVFSVLMPPPNVTGALHLGHALNDYLQDALVRYHRLRGKQTLWIPGFDHAGIATEILVEQWIQTHKLPINKNHSKLDYFYEWTEIKQKLIREQWNKLGLLINYEYEQFTFSKSFQEKVNKVFIKLYEQNLIYQGKKLVNWDCKLKTAISDIEVKHIPAKGKLFFFKYYAGKKPEDFIPVATTRPETMFADQAIMVHPQDIRYQKWIGKKVINPLTEKEIPVIAEEQIDINFGSGAVKCTPGHDFFDFKIGTKHNFKPVACFDKGGILKKIAGDFQGKDRIKSRSKIVRKLSQNNAFIKEQTHHYMVPVSSRSETIIEPLLTVQWFIKTKKWAENILKNQQNIHFFPQKYKQQLEQWLTKIEDWCISRQLTWGHRLPVYINDENKKIKVTLVSPGKNWKQSSDVLDTWFSSGLWSLVNFNWNQSLKKNLKEFLSISYLVTSYDIIFFWVARMLFLHHHFTEKIPFEKILIHGLIRTENQEKMSKSKNNVINPLRLIEKYSSDALRIYLLGQHKIGEDFNFSEEKLLQMHQFTHKLWNIHQFIKKYANEKKRTYEKIQTKEPINKWIIAEWQKCREETERFFSKHLFSLAVKNLIIFANKTWSNFYLRISWSFLTENNNEEFCQTMIKVWNDYLACLHPFLPMLSEYFYIQINEKTIFTHKWIAQEISKEKPIILDKFFAIFNSLKTKLQKKQKNIQIHIFTPEMELWKKIQSSLNLMLKPFAGVIEKVEFSESEKIFFKLKPTKNQKERDNLFQKVDFYEKEIQRSEKILKNKKFIEKANPKIVNQEKQKLKKYREILEKIKK